LHHALHDLLPGADFKVQAMINNFQLIIYVLKTCQVVGQVSGNVKK
jgi:hypothetical protein